MLRLRRLDGPGRRAYLEELRPRLLVMRVRTQRRRFVWAVPLWPFEQLLAFVLGLAVLAPSAVRLLPASTRARIGTANLSWAADLGAASLLGADEPGGLWERLSLIAAGGLGDALRLPPGEPYLSVRTDEADIDVRPY